MVLNSLARQMVDWLVDALRIGKLLHTVEHLSIPY
jgi:hypothetical protein